MIVVDASVVLDLVLGPRSPAGDTLHTRLRANEVVCAPHLLDAEVGQALHRLSLHGELSDSDVESMLTDFLNLRITRYAHDWVLARAFELRANVTVYDALYLALAEVLDCRLLTGDEALDRVPGCRAEVEVLATTA